jgi:putative RNA 2'-phosphotransferase
MVDCMNPGGMVGLAATEVFRPMVRPPTQERDRLRQTSKFLSFVLRHRPDSIGLTLDAQGWVSIEALVAAANAHGHPLDVELLHQVVLGSDKQRFALSADGSRIRANQGHSVEVDLGLPDTEPPELLYHGTATRFVASIRAQGLLPNERQHVHLSPTQLIALEVGARHGKPLVLTVLARQLHATGQPFYHSLNGVWLTRSVPSRFLAFPETGDV